MVVKFNSSQELNQLKQVKNYLVFQINFNQFPHVMSQQKLDENYILIYTAKICISEFLSINVWDHPFDRHERCPKKSGSPPFYFFPGSLE